MEEYILANFNEDGVIEDGEELKRDSADEGTSDEEKKKKEEEKEKNKTKIRKKIGPRPVLNAERLMGPRGLIALEKHFKTVKLDGRRGREHQDLKAILEHLRLWAFRLYPRGRFEDTVKKVEQLTKKKAVKNYINRIRLGLEDENGDSDLVRDEPHSPSPPPDDAFDRLLPTSHVPSSQVPSSQVPSSQVPSSQVPSSQVSTSRMSILQKTAEEQRAARIKKAKELREKFLAQQALNGQSVNNYNLCFGDKKEQSPAKQVSFQSNND